MAKLVTWLYSCIDRGPIRALSLIMALLLSGCMFFNARDFAANTSPLEVWHGVFFVWSVCSGVIFGVGFKPNHYFWQLFFAPVPAIIIMSIGIFYFFF